MVMEAPVSLKWQQGKDRKSGRYLPVPSEDGHEGLSALRAYLQWCGGFVQVLLPAILWSPGKSEEFCCALADWGVNVHLLADPTEQ